MTTLPVMVDASALSVGYMKFLPIYVSIYMYTYIHALGTNS